MREGIYRLYRRYTDDKAQTQRRLVARFVLYGESLTTLEDHDGVVESLAPDGHVNSRTIQHLHSMGASPYWELVHEDAVQAGEHPDLLPENQDGGPGHWPTRTP